MDHQTIDSFEDWIKIQKVVGIKEIVIHSSMNKLGKKQDPYVQIRPFNLDLKKDFCFFKSNNLKWYDKICEISKNHDSIIENKNDFFQIITENDCYLTMRLKHEFVALYDTNEIIFPIEFKNPNSSEYSCEISGNYCSLNHFPKSIYDFIKKIIKMELIGYETPLDSLDFYHVYYINENVTNELMMNLIKKFDKRENETSPMKVILPTKQRFWHEFIIVEHDYNHLENLIQLYETFKCLSGKYLDKNNEITTSFKKFFYYIPESLKKSRIYNSENAKTILKSDFNPIQFEKANTRTIQIDYTNARISDFGEHTYNTYVTLGSIQKLKIDTVYASYLIKNNC